MGAATAARKARKTISGAKDRTYRYNTYRFMDKDPIIDVMRTAIADSGESYAHIERRSGVTGQTLRNWFQGNTRKPQFATCQAVAKAIGREFKLVEMRPAKLH